MKLSILIPTRGNIHSLKKLISSIQNQKIDFQIETLIICNPRSSVVENRFSNVSNIQILHSSKIGANSARNIGLFAAKGEILLFVDDDCELTDPFFLKKHFELHQAQPNTTGIGGNYRLPECASYFDEAYYLQQQQWLFSGQKPGFQNDFILGGNFSLKRSLLSNYQFNESLIYGGTETDFVFQLTKAGKCIQIFPDLQITHHSNLNLTSFCKKAFFQGIGSAYLKKKNFYGVTLTQSGFFQEADQRFKIRILLSLYSLYFQAGYQYQLNNNISERYDRISFFTMSIFSLKKLFLSAWNMFREFFFYKIWNALELALYSKK
jgi:glycosyltransferase involved in cell wall biosynthesis